MEEENEDVGNEYNDAEVEKEEATESTEDELLALKMKLASAMGDSRRAGWIRRQTTKSRTLTTITTTTITTTTITTTTTADVSDLGQASSETLVHESR